MYFTTIKETRGRRLACQMAESQNSCWRSHNRDKNCRPPGPLLRRQDLFKDTLKQSIIYTMQWQDNATDRSTWQRSIHDGLVLYDDSRGERNAIKRALIHAARNETPTTSQHIYVCQHCGRTFSSRIGIPSTTHGNMLCCGGIPQDSSWKNSMA